MLWTRTLGVMTSGGKDYYKRYFAPLNQENGYDAIAGVGDEAVDGGMSDVLVVSGDAFFNLQYVSWPPMRRELELATELAKNVVANLGR